MHACLDMYIRVGLLGYRRTSSVPYHTIPDRAYSSGAWASESGAPSGGLSADSEYTYTTTSSTSSIFSNLTVQPSTELERHRTLIAFGSAEQDGVLISSKRQTAPNRMVKVFTTSACTWFDKKDEPRISSKYTRQCSPLHRRIQRSVWVKRRDKQDKHG